MFKRNGSALRQLLILQRNYLRLYLIETFLSDYIKDERTHNTEQSTVEEGKVGCIVGTYDFE